MPDIPPIRPRDYSKSGGENKIPKDPKVKSTLEKLSRAEKIRNEGGQWFPDYETAKKSADMPNNSQFILRDLDTGKKLSTTGKADMNPGSKSTKPDLRAPVKTPVTKEVGSPIPQPSPARLVPKLKPIAKSPIVPPIKTPISIPKIAIPTLPKGAVGPAAVVGLVLANKEPIADYFAGMFVDSLINAAKEGIAEAREEEERAKPCPTPDRQCRDLSKCGGRAASERGKTTSYDPWWGGTEKVPTDRYGKPVKKPKQRLF